MTRYDNASLEAVDRIQRMEECLRASIYDHRHAVFDQYVPGKQHPLPWQPDHEITRSMRLTRMTDDKCLSSQEQSVLGAYRSVGYVGELESAHGIETHHPAPVRDQGVLPGLGRQHSPIGVRDDPGPELSEHDRAEVVVRVVVSQNQIPDWLLADPPDRFGQLAALLWAGQCVDDHNSRIGDHETRIRPALRPAAGVSHDGIHTGGKAADDWRSWRRIRKGRHKAGEQYENANGKGQAAPKLMLTDCLNTAPLLSVQTMVSGASLSAFSVKLTSGSRLIPEVHSNRAISWVS